MRDSRSHRRWPVSMRPLVVILLSVCFGLGRLGRPSIASLLAIDGTERLRAQPRPPRSRTASEARRSSWRRRARRRRIRRRSSCSRNSASTEASIGRRRRSSSRWPRATRRVTPRCELALLYRMIGRSGDAEPLLTGILKQGAASTDPDVALPRGPRRARAQSRARRQHPLSRRRARRRRSRGHRDRVGPICFSRSTTSPKR